MMENETKICSKCGKELPLSEFNKCKRNKDGLQYKCKDCQKKHMGQYRAVNSERLKQYSKQHDKQRYSTIEGYAYNTRHNNLREDRKYGRIAADEDPLAPLEYYIWGIQQRDFYDGKQYHWSEMGFDRIDNSKPHTIDNIVPCTTEHNRQRGRKSFEEFCEVMRQENEELRLVLS